MIRRCLEVLGLPFDDPKTTKHAIPASDILHDDPTGPPRKQTWNYRTAVGATSYLQAMSRPDLSFSVHQTTRFSNDPKLIHEEALKRIGRYLLTTIDKGIIFKPDLDAGFTCYVDADWAGRWSPETCHLSSSAKSRTGFVIFYAGCPIMWKTTMQRLVALSTTEAEYIALSTALRDVITFMHLLEELKERGIDIPFVKPTIKCNVFEDNAACIQVAKEPKMRPRTKHLSARLHHFRQYVLNGKIDVVYVRSKENIADIFTKPLPRPAFEYLRGKLMGWSNDRPARECEISAHRP